MIEPPNKLTALLRNATPEEIFETLQRERCLTRAAFREGEKTIAVIREAEAESRRDSEQGLVGGSREYVIVLHLARHGFLTNRAKRLLNRIIIRQRWWQFWRR
jgi:hypothetical protein